MHWTEPASADDSHAELENRLWDAANGLWANAALKPSEFTPIVLGLIYEYFLGKFAMTEGQKGGEFYTPTSIVKLIIEPFHGRIFDPACGSGGMFVQSARFVENHQQNPSAEISVYGQERVAETVRLGKMNLAVHGLAGTSGRATPTTRTCITPPASSTS